MTVSIPPAIRQLLACPRCHGSLRDVRDVRDERDERGERETPSGASRNVAPDESAAGRLGLVCDACHLRFPVRDGIPVMLLDEATPSGG